MTAWMEAVMKAHAMLKKKNPKASLADAMKEAKKTYKRRGRSESPKNRKKMSSRSESPKNRKMK